MKRAERQLGNSHTNEGRGDKKLQSFSDQRVTDAIKTHSTNSKQNFRRRPLMLSQRLKKPKRKQNDGEGKRRSRQA